MTTSKRIRAADSTRATIDKLEQTARELEWYLTSFRFCAALHQVDLTLASIRAIAKSSENLK